VPWTSLSQELRNNEIVARIQYCTNQAKIVLEKKKKEKILYSRNFYIDSEGFKYSFDGKKS